MLAEKKSSAAKGRSNSGRTTAKGAKPAARKRPPEWAAARNAQKQIKRDAILGVALGALHENGYHGTSLSDIARHLGMTDAALYYYFKNKADLASESVLVSHKRVAQWLEDAAKEKTGLARVEAFVRSAAEGIAQQKIWMPATEPQWFTTALRADLRKRGLRNVERIAQFLSEGIEDKSIMLCEPKTTAAMIAGSLFFMRSWAPFATMLGAKPNGLADTAAYFVSSALARGNLSQIATAFTANRK